MTRFAILAAAAVAALTLAASTSRGALPPPGASIVAKPRPPSVTAERVRRARPIILTGRTIFPDEPGSWVWVPYRFQLEDIIPFYRRQRQ